ncbi:FAD binding domain-containing protein [Phreatobacter stygius]|uniref:Xanthine dehydrogenase family protein subunit M n=1 Tax=Phreatobacter stygius TaxID=1940610 RepID=A0A4D7AV30_9HYPH|nr:xanthine dehydrogenase family protein subunit M [Phreatobacter stygius]QCI62853.1 xanthine dehydrogenase family protein subunit M [Phreatobacter stygius]
MYPFKYHKAATVRGAVSLLKKAEEPKLLAGGQTLIPTMKQRLASPKAIIDLAGAGLSGIEQKGRTIVIGAMTTHAEVASSAAVQATIPALARLAGNIGDPQVRHKGTIGGSVANNDPAADYPAALIALGATVHTNKRKLPAEEFFAGLFSTVLDEDEIITKIAFPAPGKAAYVKFPNPASRYAIVGVFVAKKGRSVRVAVTGAGNNGVFRHAAMEEALSKRFNAKSLEGIATEAKDLNGDIHASADYRAHLVGVMARRAVAAAA